MGMEYACSENLNKKTDSNQDDQLPALTGSNRLFQRTTVYIPNLGKSERSTRHYPSTDRPTDHPTTRAKTPDISRAREEKPNKVPNNSDDQRLMAAASSNDQWHSRVFSPTVFVSRFLPMCCVRARARALATVAARAALPSPCTIHSAHAQI